MKTIYILAALLLTSSIAYTQTSSLAYTDLKTLDGTSIDSDDIIKSGSTTMLVFWKSTSNKCDENLESLQELWLDSLKENGVHMVSVCVDAIGSYSHIKPHVDGNGWDFDTYIDTNGDFRRALGVNEFPCTILLDNGHNQVARYEGFPAVSEDLLYHITLNNPIAYLEK